MKLLLLLLTFLVASNAFENFANDKNFQNAVEKSLEAEHAVWLRNHHAKKAGNPIEPGIKFVAHHNIPSNIPLIPSPGHLAAVNQHGAKCPNGYTGDLCNIPICSNQSIISPHSAAGEGEAIELATSFTCSENVTFPIDNYIDALVITIRATSAGLPSGTLVPPNGIALPPNEHTIRGEDIKYWQAKYYQPIAVAGAGYYTLQLSSENNAPCSYQITALTRAYFDSGFVQTVQDDNVQRDIYIPWRVEREPMQLTANYLGAKLSGVIAPGKPEVITFYNGDQMQYAPMPLGIRYQCDAPYISPAYTCQRTDYYKAKFTGHDHKGEVFQRIYTFACGETNPSYPPPTDGPTPPPEECFNGGTMITYGQNNKTCLCGLYYTGNQCEIKNCFNNGFLIDGQCKCASGYSGTHCQDIVCNSQSREDFDTRRRALVFIVRTTSSFAPYINSSVVASAQQIVLYAQTNNPGYYRRYVLIGYANNQITFNEEYDDYVDFINAIKALPTVSTTDNCTDSLYGALSTAVTSDSVQNYKRSAIFTFGDNLPSDPENRAALYETLSYYQGQIFTILTDASDAKCHIDSHNPEYRQLRRLAQFTHGLAPYLPVGNLSYTAFKLATGVEKMVTLATNDFVDQCSLGSKYTAFFVDNSTGVITVMATGDSLTITVMSTLGVSVAPKTTHNVGNVHIYTYETLTKGNYLLQISADQNSACQFRVYGDSAYELFTGVSDSLTTDVTHRMPKPFERESIVARLNEVYFRRTAEVFAEVVVWTNDRQTGERSVLYASNGNYRDRCDYHFIFEDFLCTQRDLQFYISLYVTDRVGFTIQRVQAGICAVPQAVPTSIGGCQNGGILDPTNSNGTCICPNGWTGDKCEKIKCKNGGTSQFNFCECRAGFSGEFCELAGCSFKTNEDFGPNRRDLIFVVHDSVTTIQMVQKMQSQMAQIIQDVTQQHPRWIQQYTLAVFSSNYNGHPVVTRDPAVFLQGFSDFAKKKCI